MPASSGQSLDPLIGREADLEHLLGVLRHERLVALTGPGGIGKTRLAREALRTIGAERLAWFVDCSAIEDPALLGATIAAALGIKGASSEDPAKVLAPAMRGQAALLVLDNLEQLRDAGEALVQLLEAQPELSILATSRVPLGVQGEQEVAVAPLGLPAGEGPDELRASPAGQLFLRRTGASGRDAPMPDATAAAIADVLRRLDGMPLAIELAAARSRVLSPDEINRRLEERGPDAIDSRRDDRRSLRSIIDWTVGQLSPEESAALEALCVCAGFDIALAEALLPEVDVIAAIESLISLGLVQRTDDVNGSSRFRLLVVIQEAVLRRVSPEQLRALRDRHAAHILDVAADWERTALTMEARGLAPAYVADADNVRRALDHLETVDAQRALVLIARLEDFWATHGRGREGYERLLALSARVPPSIELAWARLAFFNSGRMLLNNHEHRASLESALALARAFNDQDAIEEALAYCAITAMYPRDLEAIRRIAEEMEAIARPDNPASYMRLLDVRSTLASTEGNQRTDRYMALMEELVGELRAAGRERWLILTGDLAFARLARGESAEAVQLARSAAKALLELGREADASWALAVIPVALADLGRTEDAVEAAVEAAAVSSKTGLHEAAANALWAAMPVANAVGQPLLTARLFGAIDAMVDRGESMWGATDSEQAGAWMTRARRAASEVEIELAVQEGRRSDPFELLAALPDLLRSARSSSMGSVATLRHGDLTKREVEILRLIGLGRSDQEIATELFISPKTASVHVSNIKGKLGAESRLQIALRAREMGLVQAEH